MNDEFLKSLNPKNVFLDKIRIGPSWDGGYVLPKKMVDESCGVFAYGVGTDITFEVDFIKKFNKDAYLFDHTIGEVPNFQYGNEDWSKNKLFHFVNRGLGYEKNCDEFFRN